MITFAGIIQEVVRDPEITISIFSHTSSVAKAFLSQIKREFEGNADLKALFPEVLYADPARDSPSWSVDNGLIVRRQGNPKEATVEAHGLVVGMPTGRHFKLMVYDDVVTEKSVSTEDQITKTTEAWSLSDNLGSREARRWIIGTRYHYADTYAEIIERGAAKLRKYPATKDGTMDGEPVLLSQEEWAKKKQDQLESTVACQMLCDPLATGHRMFDVADLSRYEIRPEMLTIYILVDPAHSLKKDSDDSAFVVIGIDHAWNKYLLDGVAHRMELADKWRWLRDLRDKWRHETGVQGVFVGYERYGAHSDLAYFRERMAQEGAAFEITELSWPKSGGGTKKGRVQRLSPDFKSHRFYVPYPTHSERLTSTQRRRKEEGYGHMIARRIVRRDPANNKPYDLTERFLMQASDFPFCQKKDIIDAVSRIYDMEVRAPVYIDNGPIEPEWP